MDKAATILSATAAGAVLLMTAATAPAAETVTLRVADNLPATHFLAEYGIKHFMSEVTKATGGEVKFEYYPAEQAGKAKDMYALTKSGVVDIGLILPGYVSDKLPLSLVADLPGKYATACKGTMAFWQLAKDGWLAKNEYQPNGIRVLFAFVNPPYQLFFTQNRFHQLADLKGQKMRSVAGALDIMLSKLEAVPVRMTAPEVHESLARKTIDGMVFPVSQVISYGMQDLIKAATAGQGFGSTAVLYTISETKWKKLSEPTRKAMLEVGEATTRRACALSDQDVSKIYDRFKAEGISIVSVPEGDQKTLQTVFQDVAVDWAKGLDNRGKLGTATVKAFDDALGSVQ